MSNGDESNAAAKPRPARSQLGRSAGAGSSRTTSPMFCFLSSTASKARSTCCSFWRATRRSIWPRFPSSDLAEQYLAYIDAARELRLEIAADYLVMASWLAYLKSKLLLPEQEQPQDGPTGQELAAQLAFRLKRLEAMREALASMMGRKRLGIDLFSRGMPGRHSRCPVDRLFRRASSTF